MGYGLPGGRGRTVSHVRPECTSQWTTYIIIIIITAIQFSLGGSSPYTSTDKTNNIHKRNNTKTQYKQYKTQ